MSAAELAILVNRLETVTTRLEKISENQQKATSNMNAREVLSPSVLAYDQLLAGPFQSFLNLSSQIGGEVLTQAKMVESAFQCQRNFLVITSKSRQPEQNHLFSLLKPTSDCIQSIQEYREKNRVCTLFNHLSAISESIPALGWVTVSPAPAPYIKEMLDAGQFYTNRVLVDYKEKDKKHVDWVRTWLQVLAHLFDYVKQNHTTGLVWNAKGQDVGSSGGMGLPPPPPPPPPMFGDIGPPPANDPRAALFREINQGENIAKGLKRVTEDQQMHKNPDLKLQSAAPYKPPPTTARPFRPGGGQNQPAKPVVPPKFELEGKKWLVEYQVGNKNLVISDVSMNQSVHVFQCNDCMLTVKGKLNSIVLNACKKTCLVFDDLVSCVEFINCQSMQAQSMGKVPTVNVDKTDGLQLYLSKDSLNCEVITSKCSEINISIPKPNGDFVEIPVPEQYKTTWNGKSLTTIPVEMA